MRGHIRERRGRDGVSYQLIVYAGLDDAGRKTYVRETFKGPRRKAEDRLAQLIADVTRGQTSTGEDHTLAELYDAWHEAVSPRLSPNTLAGYERIWRCYLRRPLGRRRLREIGPALLERFYARQAREGGQDQMPLAPRTVRSTHMFLGTLFSTAARWGWVATPHAVDRALTPQVSSFEPVRAPASDVIRSAIAVAQTRDPQIAAFLRLAAVTGARRAELCALRWNDLDLAAQTMRIDEAVKTAPDGTLVIGPTKTHQQRTLAVDHVTCALLAALVPEAVEGHWFVFGTADGTHVISPSAWTNRWRRLRPHVPGAEHVRLHDWRHWQGTVGAERAGLQVVQHRLGHSRLSTTGIYAKSRMPADQAAADAIADELVG